MSITKFQIKYIPGAVADKQAIQDARDYLGEQRWQILTEALSDTRVRFQTLLFLIEMAGVRGYPMWAIMRAYRLTDYCAWCRMEGIQVDDDDFPSDLMHAEVVDAVMEKGDHTSH